MATSNKDLKSRGPDSFWDYVPDPSRTIFYLLLALGAFAAADWVPQMAEQIEQTRIEQRLHDARDRMLAEYERWRAKYPHLDQQYEDRLAQERRQLELEAEMEYQLAQPSTPMSPAAGESSSVPCWN